MFAFEIEMERYAKSRKVGEGTKEYEALEVEVADIVTDTYPSYDKIPAWTQRLSRFPAMGEFVAFPTGMALSTARAVRQIGIDIKNNDYKIAAARLSGIVQAAALPAVAKMVIE